MTRQAMYWVLALLLTGQAQAEIENWIFQHNGNLGGQNYLIDQEQQEVTIFLGVEGETFEFEARRGEWIGPQWVDVGPGDIDLIIANENAGPVVLTILPHIGSDDGARHVKEIDLSASGVAGSVMHVKLSGNLGELGPIIADTLGGDFVVEGNVLGDVTIQTLAAGAHFDVFGFDIDGALSVTGQGPHGGDISVEDMSSKPYGNIEIAGTMAGSIDLGSSGPA